MPSAPPMTRAASLSTGRTFRWGKTSFPVSAQVVGEELARLEVRPGQHHRARDVLEVARAPDSPLHGCFDWDDETAAELHRLDQCRAMLRSISHVFVRGDERQVVCAYIHLRDQEGPKYVNAGRVVADEEVRQLAVDEAMSALQGWKRRFEFIRGMPELRDVFEALDRLEGGRPRGRRR